MRSAKKLLRSLARRAVPSVRRSEAIPRYATLSFAQEGEDRVLIRMLGQRMSTPGFYVDVGAHHPVKFSTTYAFYLRGWRGINIDACPGSMAAFDRLRPGDVNLELAISSSGRLLTYYEFAEPARNGFREGGAEQRIAAGGYAVTAVQTLPTTTLADVLQRHLKPGQRIDFLSVDVEGMDEDVLRSNDWEAYRPEFVLAEDLASVPLVRAGSSPVVRFLDDCGYEAVGRTLHTWIFRAR